MFRIGDVVGFTPVQVHSGEDMETGIGLIYDITQDTGEYIILVRNLCGTQI